MTADIIACQKTYSAIVGDFLVISGPQREYTWSKSQMMSRTRCRQVVNLVAYSRRMIESTAEATLGGNRASLTLK